MNYTDAIIWYLSWPVLIYVAYRFVWLNIRHQAKMEHLQILEKRFEDQCRHQDPLLKEKEETRKRSKSFAESES
jgi:hypothetical protein